MNPIIMTFSDGSVFFAGLGLNLAAEALLTALRTQPARTLLSVAAAAGIVLVFASATAVAGWAQLLWAVVAVAGLLLTGRELRWRLANLAVLTLMAGGLLAGELSHRRTPTIAISPDSTVYVLGDSISAGIGGNIKLWPDVLNAQTPYRVVNLARAGAETDDGFRQARAITVPGSLVIVELGGNDLLGGTRAEDFADSFDALIALLHKAGHKVLIVELPSVPLKTAYGRAQRETAARYNAYILPRQYFAGVLTGQDNSLDGLHLSQRGHNAMADIFRKIIRVQNP